MQAAHSHIGASSMYRWSQCPGSVKLSIGITPAVSAYAQAGTDAHTVAAELLQGGKPSIELSEEDMEAVRVYTDFIDRQFAHNLLSIEERFDLSSIYPGLFGTADAVIYNPRTYYLEVVDYKHGAGIPVDVVDNPQLKYYALGALLTTKHKCETIAITIVQPRCYHIDGPVRTFVLSAMELLEFSGELADYAKATEEKDAPLKSGDHCRFCPAVAICPRLREETMLAVKNNFETPKVYDPQKLANALHIIPQIEAWIAGVHAFAYAEAVQGNPIPGYKLVDKIARRKWANEDAAKNAFVELGFRLEEICETKFKSPAQLEKVVGKANKELLTKLVVQESSGTTLVPEHDRRQAVSPKDLPEAFKNIEVEYDS